MRDFSDDPRTVLTLDAGGTNFVFSAMRANRPVIESFALPAAADDLDRSLANLVEGFHLAADAARSPVAAISFAFPAPADYFQGIIIAPRNLPAYRNVPLKAFLEDHFKVPVFINNDGDLFTYGEAAAGFLPYVNRLLEEAGSPKRYRNLIGITLGTGLGGGIVRNGELFTGDNSVAGEIWLLPHRNIREWNAEEGASIRAIRRNYAQLCGIPVDQAPEPRVIAEIAAGTAPGHAEAAREAYRRMGEIAGDVAAQLGTLLDGLIVLGGGISAAHALFLPEMTGQMNAMWTAPNGERFRRLIPQAYNLEDTAERNAFLRGETMELSVPTTGRRIVFDQLQRIGIGVTRLGTSDATAIGAYAFALNQLDQEKPQ
jgi:glucokinase